MSYYPNKVKEMSCPQCDQGNMVLRESKYGPFYGCDQYPRCDATHGAHPDGSPLGIPADKQTKQWRIKCHEYFDKLWKEDRYGCSRSDAYSILQAITGLDEEDCHIARFDIDMCKDVISKLKKYYL